MRKKLLLGIFLFSLSAMTINANAGLPCNVLVGYWQSSWGTKVRLKDINSNYNVINISFLEAGNGDGVQDNNVVGNLNFYATYEGDMMNDIPVLQAQGKKILISVGGGNGSFKLNSAAEVTTFVDKTKAIIQKYGLDGVDIDLERPIYVNQTGTISSPSSHISNVISGIQQLLTWYQGKYGKKMILTLVPEIAYTTGGISSYMASTYGAAYLPIIQTLKNDIDLVMVQLYNASENYGLDGPSGGLFYQGTADFIISQTEAIIKGFTCASGKGVYNGLSASQVAVCLPASVSSGSGYVAPATVKSAVNYLRGVGPKPGSYTLKKTGGYPGLRGMATWSVNNDLDGGYAYANNFASIFTSCLTNGTEEVPSAASFAVYPNPSDEYITLEVPELSGQTANVYSIYGQLLLSQQINTSKTIIDVSNLAPGQYVIKYNNVAKVILVQ